MKELSDIQVLCVDDEQEVLLSLRRALRKSPFKVEFVLSGEKALEFMSEQHVDILISDMRMPEMSGAQLFTHVNTHSPDTFKILLTGFSDLESTVEAINQGSIDKYLQKPWKNDKLIELIEQGIEKTRLTDEINGLMGMSERQNQQLKSLNENLEEVVEKRTHQIQIALKKIDSEYRSTHQLLFNLIRFSPLLDEKFAIQVSKLMFKLAKALPEESQSNGSMRLSGLLCEIGLLGVDPGLLETPVSQLKYDQLSAFKHQVVQAQMMISPAQHLKKVSQIIAMQYEQLDGKGYPDGLNENDIPFGAKLLAVSRDFWRLVSGRQTGEPMSSEDALQEMTKYRNILYAPSVLDALKGLDDPLEDGSVVKSITTDQLQPGLVLTESIINENQVPILVEGHIFSSESIEKLLLLEGNQELKLHLKVTG